MLLPLYLFLRALSALMRAVTDHFEPEDWR